MRDGRGTLHRDDRVLSNSPSVTIRAFPALSIADARAHEGTDETIDFVVSLDRAALHPLTVDYTTSDGSAKAEEDYTATSGTLTFTIGQRSKTIEVPVLDDAKDEDEDEETFTLTLSNAAGARIADGTATGTIENSDPLQQAWIARFGRTVASQVVEAASERVSGNRAANHLTIEGAVHALVAHEESGYEEWGASASVRIDPGTSGRGLSLSITPTWGAPASGVEQLWGLEHTRGLAEDREFDADGRLDAELGYPLCFHSRMNRGSRIAYLTLLPDTGAS